VATGCSLVDREDAPVSGCIGEGCLAHCGDPLGEA
jgi:hypothetical protein